MTLEQLKTFVTVFEAESFTKAADILSLSQPAVSQQILTLEKYLGHRVFDRNGRSLTLTTAGERVLGYARSILTEANEMLDELRGMNGHMQGLVTVGAIHSVGVYLLPGLIAKFQALHPSVKIGLKVGNTEQIMDELVRGTLDIVLLDQEIASVKNRYFHQEPYCVEELILGVPPGHPWAGRNDLQVEELYQEQFIMRERSSRSRAVLESELIKAGVDIHQLGVTLELGSNEAIKQSISAGLGMAFLPDLMIKQPLEWGIMGRAQLENRPIFRQIWLHSATKVSHQSRMAAFKTFLLEQQLQMSRHMV